MPKTGVIESAMHLMDGYQIAVTEQRWEAQQEILEDNSMGFAEFVNTLVPVAEAIEEAYKKRSDQITGIWDYDVSCVLGTWIGDQMLERKELICHSEILDKLEELAENATK